MFESMLDRLKKTAGLVRPSAVRRLRDAGVLEPRTAVSAGLVTPWLIGRGPSFGIVSQMNAWALRSKPAIHDRLGTLSHAELDARANQLGRALTAAGIRPGSRIGILLRNGREFLESILACHKFGFVASPLNTWGQAPELKAIMADLDPDVLI